MRYLSPIVTVSALVGLSSPALGQQTGEILRGEILAATCFTCHGTDGKSPGAIPAINGIPASSLRQTLEEFRDGRRPSTVMGRHASGYTDEEIASLADYLSGLK